MMKPLDEQKSILSDVISKLNEIISIVNKMSDLSILSGRDRINNHIISNKVNEIIKCFPEFTEENNESIPTDIK